MRKKLQPFIDLLFTLVILFATMVVLYFMMLGLTLLN